MDNDYNFEAINSALYRIAEQAHEAEDMQQFFASIHKIIANLTYAENFFIALHDEEKNNLSIPYIVDTASDINVKSLAKLPVETLNQTLTGYMLRTGKMLHANAELIDELEAKGEINELGELPNEWVGFPLKKGKKVIGGIVLQSYDSEVSYSNKDIYLLMFVSQHLATALTRKQSEDALRESEKKLREVLENSNVISYKFNLELNIYEYVSNNIKFIFGYTPEEYLAIDFEEAKNRIHPDDRNNYREQFKKLMVRASTGKHSNIPVVEYRWRHKRDNKYHWFSDTRRVICNEDDIAVSIIGSVRDITDAKNAEQKLRETEEELHKMQELESIGILAGGLAHDFNNILTGIFGNISLAKMKMASDHLSFKYLEKAENSMDRATRLTRQLLTFSKGGEPIKEGVELTNLIEETTLFDLSGSNVKPLFDFSKNSLEAHVDKGQIQQVISNLVINANQAMPEGGHLHIGVENIKISDNNELSIHRGRYTKIIIKDEGTGIDKNTYARIFDPYFTTKPEGSGLGLTTVYSIIKKHDGYLTVDSEKGKGSTFTIYLPVIELKSELGLMSETENNQITEHNNILVMDDDSDILNLVTAILEMNNYTVDTALDGKEMLDKYQNAMGSSKSFDVVIMDLTIPGGMGGKEAVKELLKIDAEAKCIVSSGYADDPIMAHYKDYGFKAAIAKPFTQSGLTSVLVSII